MTPAESGDNGSKLVHIEALRFFRGSRALYPMPALSQAHALGPGSRDPARDSATGLRPLPMLGTARRRVVRRCELPRSRSATH